MVIGLPNPPLPARRGREGGQTPSGGRPHNENNYIIIYILARPSKERSEKSYPARLQINQRAAAEETMHACGHLLQHLNLQSAVRSKGTIHSISLLPEAPLFLRTKGAQGRRHQPLSISGPKRAALSHPVVEPPRYPPLSSPLPARRFPPAGGGALGSRPDWPVDRPRQHLELPTAASPSLRFTRLAVLALHEPGLSFRPGTE